ncbi:MAG: hypothetical protein SCH70_13565 [Candidatus Methanoperedens sp.]|nr:hypothetical protein [Candidatus Methanoperedens sp.]
MKKSKGMQLGALLAAMLLLSMAFVPAVSAKADVEKDKIIVDVIDLQPEATSEVILDSLKATRWSDGPVTISGSGEKQVGEPAQYFHWEINLSKGTYKTTKLAVSDLVETTPIITKIEKNKGKLNSDGSVTALTSDQYTATVLVVTDDPLGEDLAKTTHQLTWTINTDGTVTKDWRSVSCWAANPSSQDTHWFVDSCNFFGSVTYSSDRTSLFSEVKSKFHNYDWGIDSWATYAEHWSKIQGRNDSWYNYWWDTTHSGEDWFLLDGDVYAS